jgi:hypothetical protein
MEDGTYCIIDFRLSKFINKNSNHSSVSISKAFIKKIDCGTEEYIAPEIL